MKFKTEVGLLVLAIVLFGAASFFYSYALSNDIASLSTQKFAYPYRGLAMVFLGVGSVSMVTASVSYSKKTKEMVC